MKRSTISCALVCTAALALGGCWGAQKAGVSEACAASLKSASEARSFADSEGFAGTVSYTKGISLQGVAKSAQQVENYDDCVEKADKAAYYFREAKEGK